MSRPPEVRVPAAVLVGGALAFVALGLARDFDAAKAPLVLAVLAGLAVAGLWLRTRPARAAAVAVCAVVALAHALIALGGLPWGYRVASGLLAAAHAYAAVLLLTRPAREDQEGPSCD